MRTRAFSIPTPLVDSHHLRASVGLFSLRERACGLQPPAQAPTPTVTLPVFSWHTAHRRLAFLTVPSRGFEGPHAFRSKHPDGADPTVSTPQPSTPSRESNASNALKPEGLSRAAVRMLPRPKSPGPPPGHPPPSTLRRGLHPPGSRGPCGGVCPPRPPSA